MVKKEGKEDRYMYLHLNLGWYRQACTCSSLVGKNIPLRYTESDLRYLNQAGFLELPLLPYTVNLQLPLSRMEVK